MSEETGLLAAILASPMDELARLAYADWLEENGQEPAMDGYVIRALRRDLEWPWVIWWDEGMSRRLTWLGSDVPAPIGGCATDDFSKSVYELANNGQLVKWKLGGTVQVCLADAYCQKSAPVNPDTQLIECSDYGVPHFGVRACFNWNWWK